MDNEGQASAELILLFGGIMVVVLLVIYMYKNYMNDLNGEIYSEEFNKFNNEFQQIKQYFK